MTDFSMKLSAYLDGELSDEDTRMVEEKLASDPQAGREMEMLVAANNMAKQQFDDLLKEPVPLNVIRAINDASADSRPRVSAFPVWQALAACLVMSVVGGAGGYYLHDKIGTSQIVVAKAGWLSEIADYHAVYAKQKRHLVEVPGTERAHIEKWLGGTTKVNFSVPDLQELGFNFEGARLLVINGQPVAQLIYKETSGAIVAICLKKNSKGQQASVGKTFKTDQIMGFEFVSWNSRDANYTVVGASEQPHLQDIAERAASEI